MKKNLLLRKKPPVEETPVEEAVEESAPVEEAPVEKAPVEERLEKLIDYFNNLYRLRINIDF